MKFLVLSFELMDCCVLGNEKFLITFTVGLELLELFLKLAVYFVFIFEFVCQGLDPLGKLVQDWELLWTGLELFVDFVKFGKFGWKFLSEEIDLKHGNIPISLQLVLAYLQQIFLFLLFLQLINCLLILLFQRYIHFLQFLSFFSHGIWRLKHFFFNIDSFLIQKWF